MNAPVSTTDDRTSQEQKTLHDQQATPSHVLGTATRTFHTMSAKWRQAFPIYWLMWVGLYWHLPEVLAAQLSFSDATMATANWTAIQIPCSNGGNSVGTSFTTGGCNPDFGPHMRIVNSLSAGTGPAAVIGVYLMNGVAFDPSFDGTIASVSYSECAKQFASDGDGQATGPALRQAGKIYLVSSTLWLPTALQNWTTLTIKDLCATDFELVDCASPTLRDPTQHPNFCMSGPIEFGFFRATSRPTGGPASTREIGIDSWKMQVNTHAVCGTKFADWNGNGIQDFGEPGLPGWRITLGTSPNAPLKASTVTDSAGNYCFENLACGTYFLQEIGQPGWVQTFPSPFSGGLHQVTVAPCGPAIVQFNFGNVMEDCIEPPAQMVAWWPMDEANGSSSLQEVILGSNATPSGGTIGWPGPVAVPGTVAGGMFFPQPDLGFATASLLPSQCLGAGEFTIDAWVNPSQSTFSHPIVEQLSATAGYSLFLKGLTLHLHLQWPVPPFFATCTGPILVPNSWQHVAVTISANRSITFYLNGVAFPALCIPVPPANATFNNTSPLLIANSILSGLSPFAEVAIDELELFDRMLNPQEIQGLYYAGPSGKCKRICGQKFNDLDHDGVKDMDEPGLPGWKVEIKSGNQVVSSATTDSDGSYRIKVKDLPGSPPYTVEEIQKQGWIQSYGFGYSVPSSNGLSRFDFGNWCEVVGDPIVYRAGLNDNSAYPEEPTWRRACFDGLKSPGDWKNFDDGSINRWIGYTFANLPPGIVRATLNIAMKPECATEGNDSISLGFDCANGWSWSSHINSLPEANLTWDCTKNAKTTFNIDLTTLPGNLLAKLASDAYLDVAVQDDTTVDWMELTVWRCADAPALPCEPGATLSISTATGGNISITWPFASYRLQATDVLNFTTIWTDIPMTSPVVLPLNSLYRYFRLVCP